MDRQHEKGIGSRQLAAEYGVGKTQINNIVTAKADHLKRQSLDLYSMHRVYVQCILHDNNIIQYNNACIIIMPGFDVGPEKELTPQQRPPTL